MYADLPLRPDQEGPRQAPGGAGPAGQALQPPPGRLGLPGLRQRRQPDAGQRLRQRGRRRRPAQRRHDGGPLRPRRQDGDRPVHPARPVGRHPGRRERDLGHEPHQRGLQLGPDLLVQTIEQDLGIPINHYMAVDFPGFSGMVERAGRHHHGLPDPGQGRVHRARRDHDGLPGGERDGGAAAGAQPAPLLHELERLLGVRRPVGLQPHPAPGRLLPGRAGQGQRRPSPTPSPSTRSSVPPWAT